MLLQLKEEYKNHFFIIVNTNDFKREKQNNNIKTSYVQLLICLEEYASNVALQLLKKSKKVSVLKCKNNKPKTENLFFIKILINGNVYWANKEYFKRI